MDRTRIYDALLFVGEIVIYMAALLNERNCVCLLLLPLRKIFADKAIVQQFRRHHVDILLREPLLREPLL